MPPQLPSTVKQVFVPVRVPLRTALSEMKRGQSWSVQAEDGYLVYEPALIGLSTLLFPHNKSRQTHTERVAYFLPLEGEGYVVDWSAGKVKLEADDLDRQAEADAYFVELPSDLGTAKRHTALRKEFEDYIYYNSSQTLWHNPHVELFSTFGESDTAFARRCQKAAKEARDTEAKKLEAKYERELDRLEDRLRREERELDEDKIEYDARKQEEVLSGVESVLGVFTKRRVSRGLSTASRRRRMTRQAKADIEESEAEIKELEDKIDELEAEAKEELEDLAALWAEQAEEREEVEVRPRRTDVRIDLFALAWVPRWEVRVGDQAVTMPAHEIEPA